MRYHLIPFFFFFQAEDGIRDDLVTGVQTCALPICSGSRSASLHARRRASVRTSAKPIASGRSCSIGVSCWKIKAPPPLGAGCKVAGFGATNAPMEGAMQSVVIHPLVVRITHWLNVLAVLIMITSGWQIYNASPLFGFEFPPQITLGGRLAG